MATVTEVATPKTLDTMGVDLALRHNAINTKLRMDVMLDDVYEQFGGEVIKDPEGSAVPNSIYLNLTAGKDGSKGTNSVTVPMLLHLTGDLILGGAKASGQEETQQMRSFTMYYEEYGYNVASTNYGRNKNEMEMYGVFEKIEPQISIFLKEMHGMRVREASLQGNDHVIQNLGGATAARWNSNWFIAGANPALSISGGGAIDGYGQPVWDSTANTYSAHLAATAGETTAPFFADGTAAPYGGFSETIAEVMNGAATSGAATGSNASVKYFRSLEYYARTVKKIDPLDGGKYIAVVPSSQIKVLGDNTSDTLGEVFIDQHRKTGDVVNYTPHMGYVGSIELYSDDRYPTLLVLAGEVDTVDEIDNANGVAYFGLIPSYVQPGGVDNRGLGVHDATSNKNWDIGFLYGKAALCEWVVDEVHFEYEVQDYRRNQGTGAFGMSGIRLVEYDVDAGWANDGSGQARENIGSIVLAFTSPSITA